MNLFLSWSGEKSQRVASKFYDWIQEVLQPVKPWMSSRNIQAGSLWEKVLHDTLGNTNFGIVFITNDNKDRPFIHFESGILCKGLELSRVCTFLIDMQPEDLLNNPLTAFQATVPTQERIKALILDLNSHLGEHMVDKSVLEKVIDKNILELIDAITSINTERKLKIAKPATEDLLVEILQTVRSQENKLRDLELTIAEYLNPEPPEEGFIDLKSNKFRFKKPMTRLILDDSKAAQLAFRSIYYGRFKQHPSADEVELFQHYNNRNPDFEVALKHTIDEILQHKKEYNDAPTTKKD